MNNFWVRFRRNLLSDEGLGLVFAVVKSALWSCGLLAFWQWLGAPLWAAVMGTLIIWSIDRLVLVAVKLEKWLGK